MLKSFISAFDKSKLNIQGICRTVLHESFLRLQSEEHGKKGFDLLGDNKPGLWDRGAGAAGLALLSHRTHKAAPTVSSRKSLSQNSQTLCPAGKCCI